jgi:hypothetical protein
MYTYTVDGVGLDGLTIAVDAIGRIRSPEGGCWSVSGEVVECPDGSPALCVTSHARDSWGCSRRGRHALVVALSALRAAGHTVGTSAVLLFCIDRPAPHGNRGRNRTTESPSKDEFEDEKLIP